MKKILSFFLVLAIMLLSSLPALAGKAEEFRKIKVLDDIMVFMDVDGGTLKADEVKAYAAESFARYMRGMQVKKGVGENYRAEGYTLDNLGYIIMKVMSIHTRSGVNVYHLGFEFGVPPRDVYWDTATMGIAPTRMSLKKEVLEDVDEVMKNFADAFYGIRGE